MSHGAVAGPVAHWFAELPLSDPRCNNNSCLAFAHEGDMSQAAVPWLSQFRYGHWLSWVFAIVIFLYSAYFFAQGLPKNSAVDKTTAAIRFLSYRRLKGRLAEYLSLPTLGVSVVILFFWAAATIMSFAQQPLYRERRGYGSPPLGVRTGMMAFALMPLTFATAGKASLITLITGLGHEKLNTFHRWSGQLMLYLSIIHTVPFIAQPLWEGGAGMLRDAVYAPGAAEYTGIPALGMLVGLATLSIPPLRRAAYELFVQLHILLAIVYLGLCFWHAADLGDSWAYLWATLAIYLSQILIRWFGYTSTFYLRDTWLEPAPVALTQMQDMIKMEVEVRGRLKWEPGQHAFLRFPKLRLLDNHPFTIACISEEALYTRLVFYIRPRNGLTAQLAGKTLSAIVDGPYGTILRPRVETRYDTAILVAGGGGFSGVLPWLQHLAKHTSIRITFIWAVKSRACLLWATEFRDVLQTPGLKVDVWVTGEQAGKESDAMFPNAHFGRPCVSELLDGLVGQKTIVLGCGPESLKIDLSNAVAGLQSRVIKGEAQEIRLHTETFGW